MSTFATDQANRTDKFGIVYMAIAIHKSKNVDILFCRVISVFVIIIHRVTSRPMFVNEITIIPGALQIAIISPSEYG